MFDITLAEVMDFIIRALVLFTAMPVHECAHGLMADRLGDDTPRNQGRLTLNPFAHLDFAGSLLLFFTGFGWAKPVEVDMRKFRNPRRDMAITAAAGPLSNFIMATFVMIFYKILLVYVPPFRESYHVEMLVYMFQVIIFLNICLGVFNLLPVPPLDGSKIIGIILPNKLYWSMLRYQRQIALVVMALLLFGVLPVPLGIAARKVYALLDIVTSPIDAILYR